MKGFASVENRVKVALLFLAILLWFFVVSNRDYEADFSIPLVIRGLEAGYLFVEDPPQSVDIACRGRGRDLLVWRHFLGAHLELNISGFSTKQDFPLVPQMIAMPAGFSIQNLRIAWPETLRLYIDRMAETRVPVRADCEIIPEVSFVQVGPTLCEPDSISIRGPQILIQQVDELVTRHRRFLHVDESIETRLSLRNVFSSKILLEVQNVLVRAVVEALEQVRHDSVAIEVRNLPQGMLCVISPTHANVVLEGPKSSLAALDSLPPRLVLDYGVDWRKEQSNYIPAFEGPPLVRLAAMDPPEVSWTIQEAATQKSKRR